MARLVSLEPAEIAVQTRKLAELSDALDQAANAGAGVSLGATDFGRMCSFLSPYFTSATAEAVESIRAASDVQLRAIDELKGVVGDFSSSEEATAATLNGLNDQVCAVTL